MVPIVEVKGVKKAYQLGKVSVPALRGVSFNIDKGEFLTIFGPSGSGKSTLLHLIGGLDRPDEGDIIVDGSNLLQLDNDKLAKLRLTKIGFVFQFFNLLPRITALANVELPLAIADLPEKESRERAKKTLKLVGLESRVDHRPSELSGGEQQRVAIARALINNPKIILADEPTGNLDTKIGREIVQLMRKLNKEEGLTLVIITHDTTVAESADRVVNLKDGLIEDIKENAGRTGP